MVGFSLGVFEIVDKVITWRFQILSFLLECWNSQRKRWGWFFLKNSCRWFNTQCPFCHLIQFRRLWIHGAPYRDSFFRLYFTPHWTGIEYPTFPFVLSFNPAQNYGENIFLHVRVICVDQFRLLSIYIPKFLTVSL